MIDRKRLHKRYYKSYKYDIRYNWHYMRGFFEEKDLTYTEYLEQRLNEEEQDLLSEKTLLKPKSYKFT